MINIFGSCPKCGIKFGRKTTFCYNCMEDSSREQQEDIHRTTDENIRFIPIALAVILALIIFIFLRAQKLGISLM